MAEDARSLRQETCRVDTHVHLYPCHETGVFLDAARSHTGDGTGVLMLTESAGFDVFSQFVSNGLPAGLPDWSITPTPEEGAALLLYRGEPALLLVSGWQINTAERLEVLALGTRTRVADGLTLSETLAEVKAADGVPVIPWGFGKWWGTRGRILLDWLSGADAAAGVFLGDNGNRPAGAPEPAPMRLARARGVAVLPGSDPLSLPGHARRPGSYGLQLSAALSPETPLTDLKTALRALRPETVSTYGRRLGFPSFLAANLALRLQKR